MWRFVMFFFLILMPKIKKNNFSHFIYYYFSFNSNFTLNFCELLCNAIEKVSCKKCRKSIHEIQIYANFSYMCARKPMGRIDPSRLERLKWEAAACAFGMQTTPPQFFFMFMIKSLSFCEVTTFILFINIVYNNQDLF